MKTETIVKIVATTAFCAILLSTAALSACAGTQQTPTDQQAFISELTTAMDQDRANARASRDPVEAADCANQAEAADRAIRELRNGYDISPTEMRMYLEVPPPSISDSERAQLIDQLEAAKAKDQRMMEISTDELVAADVYREREVDIDGLVKSLRIGDDVPWTAVQQAIYVPQNR
jgi:hypothetical protein